MKTIVTSFFIIVVCLLGVSDTFAAPHPPLPNNGKKPPPPPGLSIDDNLYVVFILALLFGIYIIYSYNLKTKTPI